MKKLVVWGGQLCEGKLGRVDAAVTFIALYCAFQLVILTAIGHWGETGVNIDDAEQLIYMPYLWAGYGGSQPPLYTWLCWAVSQLFGDGHLTLKVVKYLLLFVALFSVYAAVRELGSARRTAAAASLGMLTFAQIVWESQHALTHSVGALAFSALAFLTLVRLFNNRSPLGYVLFGAAAALSILAKVNDLVFLAGMLAAAFSLREYRSALVNRWFVLSVVVIVIMILPTALWSFHNQDAILARTYKFGLDQVGRNPLLVRATGLWELAVATFDFVILALLVIGAAFATERLQPAIVASGTTPGARFLWRTLAIAFGLTVLLVLASGTTSVRDRWLLPILFLLPAGAAVWAEALGPRGRNVQYFIAGIAVAIAIVIVPVTWYAQVMGGQGKARSVRLNYASLLSDIEKQGPVRTVVGGASWIGNFRLIDPSLVILNPEVPGFGTLLQTPVVMVWLDDDQPDPRLAEFIRQAGYVPKGQPEQAMVPEKFNPAGRRVSFVRMEKQGQ